MLPRPFRTIAALLAGSLLAVAHAGAAPMFGDGFEGGVAPMPLLSRGRPTLTSDGDGGMAVDGTYFGGHWWETHPTAQQPGWIAIDVGDGPTRAMLSFVVFPGTPPPRDYRIETTSDPQPGPATVWTLAAAIEENPAPSRAHAFAFAGQRWVRLVVTAPQTTVAYNEIDIHDASRGTRDTWMFIGDSITAAAFSRGAGADNFPERLHARFASHFPLMIGAGVGGTYSQDGVEQVEQWLALHPLMHNWVISYGTNDSANGDPALAAGYRERMQVIVDRLHAAGKTVWVPRIPYNIYSAGYMPAYNAVVDELVATRGVQRGPDLYAHFLAHPEQLGDGVHPTDYGSAEINRLWAETVAPLYSP